MLRAHTEAAAHQQHKPAGVGVKPLQSVAALAPRAVAAAQMQGARS
jgi:hypothetical protein